MKPQKEVVLPLWMREVAIQVALTSCENEGLSPPPGFDSNLFDDPKFRDQKNAFLDHFHHTVYNFCKEAYLHSLTPSGELKSNPGSPQMSKDIYQYFKFFYGPGGYLEKYTGGMTPAEKNDQIRQMKASVMHLAMLYLRLKAKKKKEDFVFPEKAGEAQLRKAIINRYYRILVNASTHAVLEALFSTEAAEIESFLHKANFKGKDKNGKELDFSLDKSSVAELQSDTARQAFAQLVFQAVEKSMKDVSVGKALFEI